MVLAVQAYGQFHQIGLDTSLGAVIHMSVVRELGPVLAALMLAGRVGSGIASELGSMIVTEQINAIRQVVGITKHVHNSTTNRILPSFVHKIGFLKIVTC